MTYRGKEFFDIAFECVNCLCIIFSFLPQKCLQTTHCHVRSFSNATRITVMNQPFFKKRFDDIHNRLVNHSIFHTRLMNQSLFRIINRKRFVWAVNVGSGNKLFPQRKQMVFQISLIQHDILSFPFAFTKTFPCKKEIFNRNNLFK